MRRLFTTLVAFLVVIATGLPALASTGFAVSVPGSIQYDPSTDGFAVTGIGVTNAPSYIQIGLTLTDTYGVQVNANDVFRISVANQCALDPSWTNGATGGSVVISGDDTPNVIISGNTDDVVAAIDQLWIYRQDSTFCGRGSAAGFGQSLLLRKLQVSAIESAPGLFWSPSTQHYYQLATQTTDDGMGQPTDDNGTITDPSRYFVRWSTARSEAKATTITIGGNTHTGYLASITTKDEFSFLNNNVSGGSGVLYPAWVGGSDAGSEGIWKWVDGPEAKQFGGDSLQHNLDQLVAPDGKALEQDSEGNYYINYPTEGNDYYSMAQDVMFLYDGDGNQMVDNISGYKKVLNTDQYCSGYWNDYWNSVTNFEAYGPQIDSTPYGSLVICNVAYDDRGYPRLHPQIQDSHGNLYDPTPNSIYKNGDWGYWAQDSDNNFLAVTIGTSDFTHHTGSVDNYNGATFWGPDTSGVPGSGNPDFCTNRGVRGVCHQSQKDATGAWQDNNYFVYWSNGSRSYNANWDGTGRKLGDGVYNPQPDNYTGNDARGEDALIVNWCVRNPYSGYNTSAPEETLYGNSGYHCTPGWNDLPAGSWGLASTSYPNGNSYDTPNLIGTTDYIVEFCGYSDEASCATDPATVAHVGFSITDQGCGQGSSQLNVSYSAAHVDATELTSSTMATETFDNIPAGQVQDQMINVGYMEGTTYAGGASIYGGAGGTGNYVEAVDTWVTLPTTECYLGFWWSAGNAGNHVDLTDAGNNVLASFDSAALTSALGACPNDYCGNPNDNFSNGNELYAFVHMRLPSGFAKVHIYGRGFELDNLTLSISVPGRSSGETNLSGPTELVLDVPQVVLVDPRVAAVTFPGVRVSGDSSATLCFRQVSDSEGTPLLGDPTAEFADDQNDNLTTQRINRDFVASGAIGDVESASSHLASSAISLSRLAEGGSLFFRVSATAGATPDATTCDAGVHRIVEVRPISLDVVSNLETIFGNG